MCFPEQVNKTPTCNSNSSKNSPYHQRFFQTSSISVICSFNFFSFNYELLLILIPSSSSQVIYLHLAFIITMNTSMDDKVNLVKLFFAFTYSFPSTVVLAWDLRVFSSSRSQVQFFPVSIRMA